MLAWTWRWQTGRTLAQVLVIATANAWCMQVPAALSVCYSKPDGGLAGFEAGRWGNTMVLRSPALHIYWELYKNGRLM